MMKITAALIGLLWAGQAMAGASDVVGAKASWSGNSWRFDVTLRHADTGWDHYADAWRVVGADGTVYGTRTLYHPHVDEQPFTRSLTGVVIPEGVTSVKIESHDSVHGWSGKTMTIQLNR